MGKLEEREKLINSLKENFKAIIFSLIAAYNRNDSNGIIRITKIINKSIELLSGSIESNRKEGGESFTELNTLLIKIDPIIKEIIKNINNERALKSYFDSLSDSNKQLLKL